MSVLSPDRWRAVEPHLDRVLQMESEEREAFLGALRATEPEIAAEGAS